MSFRGTLHCLQDSVFCVFHHFAIPNGRAVDSPVEIRTVNLGIYATFSCAQAVAVSALELNLKGLQSAGFIGKYCNDIDLRRRGLITQITRNGQERPLSEYEIQAMPLQDRAVYGNLSLQVFGEKTTMTKSLVPIPSEGTSPTIIEIEQDPLWAQSRIPYFRKRDDAPFRSVDEPAYATSFIMNTPEARKLAANGVTANKHDKTRAVTNVPPQRITSDHNLEVLSKPEYMEAEGEEQSGMDSLRVHFDGGNDIGPIYRGRRHSISLD